MPKLIAYWLTTALLAVAYLFGGYVDLAQPQELVEGAAHLGYPLYFFSILGFWKIAAGVVILLPALPRVKEWAYAGIVINLTGASATHVFAHDPVKEISTPLIVLAIAVASWYLRPANRRLAGPWL